MTKEKLSQYDALCERCFYNFYSVGVRNEGRVLLKDFDPQQKSHQFALMVATQVAANFDMTIVTNAGFWTRIKMYWPRRKTIGWIKHINNPKGDSIDELLSFSACGEDMAIYGEIYDAYFGGK